MNGVFPAVALSGGLGTLAVREGDPRVAGWLVVYLFPVTKPDELTQLARFALPAGSPCFPNLYVLDGLTWLAYHDGQRQRLHNLTTGRDVLAVAGLSNPSAFGAGSFAYAEPVQPYRVHRLNLRTGEADQPRLGAPTGLSRILDDGHVVTIDEDRFALEGATIPSFAGPLAVGEGPVGGVVWSFRLPTSDFRLPTSDSIITGVLYPGLDSFTPKCAADGDTLAITTAGPDVRLFCGTLSALIAASQLPATPPPPPKVPGPIVNNPPKEPAMSYVPQAPDLTDLIRALAVQYPVEWAEAYEYDGHPRTDRFVKIVAPAAHARDPRFGLNGKRGSDVLSLDVLAFKNPTVPESCGGVELRDFIYDNGRPGDGEHRVVWSDVTIVPGMRPDLPDGVRGKWIQPQGAVPVPVPPPVPVPVPVPAPPPAPTHPSYDEMMAMVEACNRAYGREMSAELTAHLVWRYLLEGYAVSDMIEDARERGRG